MMNDRCIGKYSAWKKKSAFRKTATSNGLTLLQFYIELKTQNFFTN
jgi:hypothetical protein